MSLVRAFLLLFCSLAASQDLPTLYQYYTNGGIQTGISVSQPYFTLNGRNLSLYSAGIHYFRVPKPYWRDRLRKARAAGLNSVETYISWNLHEYQNGTYDFGAGGSEYQDFLDVVEFLKLAQEEDLLAIVRVGPFISAEFENGGYPSWLLRGDSVKLRTSEAAYMQYVTRWFNVLLPKLAPLQFSKGGPIIMFQVENEYANCGLKDFTYLQQLRQLMLDNGITELLTTSDGYTRGQDGTLPGVLFQTINFNGDSVGTAFSTLKSMQPDKPLMVMEYWTGWFDYVGQTHQTKTLDKFRSQYQSMIQYPANLNMYMFLGGTNFGFLNGASQSNPPNYASFNPVPTSYDYDAPLSEDGDYTGKYEAVAELLAENNPIKTRLPARPTPTKKVAYSTLQIQEYLEASSIAELTENLPSQRPISQEFLPINGNSGQSYGYTIYKKESVNITAGSTLTINGYVLDHVLVLVNGKLINNKPLTSVDDFTGFGYWKVQNPNITLPDTVSNARLELIVENMGRASSSSPAKKMKGIFLGGIFIDNKELLDWNILPLEFKKQWNQRLSGLNSWKSTPVSVPAFFRTTLNITGEPNDTFIDIRNWNKGFVIVNGFVLGRYQSIGPVLHLYLPAPFLKTGSNEIIFFEEFQAGTEVRFTNSTIFI